MYMCTHLNVNIYIYICDSVAPGARYYRRGSRGTQLAGHDRLGNRLEGPNPWGKFRKFNSTRNITLGPVKRRLVPKPPYLWFFVGGLCLERVQRTGG